MYHVLVVEDELLIRDAIVEMVENYGSDYKVVGEASSGEEAWRLIQELWPTVLITDIQMPDMDGIALIRQIREHELPIVSIIISGHENFQYAQSAIRLGVSEYLLKPISEQELHSSLSRSLGRLETLAESNRIFVHMQQFLDGMGEVNQVDLLKNSDTIVHSIFDHYAGNVGVRRSILRIFWGKLHEYIKSIAPDYPDRPLPAPDEQREIRQAFRVIIHDWIRYYPQYANNNMKLVIRQACEEIWNRYTEELTATQIAHLCNLSVSYFGVLFKQYTGKTFVNYVNQVRIEKAMELLRSTDMKIYEVSEEVGYSSLPYFNRVFKHVANVTPNEYRKSLGL